MIEYAMQCGETNPVLLLTSRQAARALAVCEKTLWTLTKNGAIPAVRIGRAVRYDPADLQRYIESAKCQEENP